MTIIIKGYKKNYRYTFWLKFVIGFKLKDKNA